MNLKSKIIIITIIVYLYIAVINFIPIVIQESFLNTFELSMQQWYYDHYVVPNIYASIILGIILAVSYTLFILQFMFSFRVIKSEEDRAFRKKFHKITSRRFYIVLGFSFLVLMIFAYMSYLELRYLTSFLIIGLIIITGFVLNKLNKRIFEQIELFKGFQSLIANRDKIDMDEIKNHFKFDSKTFYNKLLEWSERFDMRIDGDYVLFNLDTVSEFINELDSEYRKWGKTEQLKVSKIN